MTTLADLRDRDLVESTMTETAFAYLPVRTVCPAADCGVDPMTGGAIKINCATCGGKGYVTTFFRNEFRCRVDWRNGLAPNMLGGLVPTPDMGDVVLYVGVADGVLMERVKAEPGAYLLIEGGKTVRPKSVSRHRVLVDTCVEVECVLATGISERS